MIFANAASMMRDEQPKVNKWCCSLSWLGMQAWVYTKIVTDCLVVLTSTLPVFFNGFDRHIFGTESTNSLLGVIVFTLFVDIGFQISSIVGVHKKCYNLLRIFHYYEIFAIAIDIVLTPVILYMTNTERVHVDVYKTVLILTVGIFYMLLDICIVRKVKEEIRKIHHKYELSSLHE